MLRVKPDHNITEESFSCQLIDPVDVSSTSIFEDGEELISNIVHIAPTAVNIYKVSHHSNFADLRFLLISFVLHLGKISSVMYMYAQQYVRENSCIVVAQRNLHAAIVQNTLRLINFNFVS